MTSARTTTSMLWSEFNRSDAIAWQKQTTSMTPVIVYLSVLMFFGLPGNILVCFYYGRQTRRSSHFVFICTLAMFDLVSCGVSIPIDMVDLAYKFTDSILCKFVRYINYMAAMGSVLTLIAIAIDRFRRICRPFEKQLSLNKAILTVGISAAVALFYSIPVVVFYTSVEVFLKGEDGQNVTEKECSLDKYGRYKDFIWIFHGLYIITFGVCTGILCLMYSMIGRTLFRRKNRNRLHSRNKDGDAYALSYRQTSFDIAKEGTSVTNDASNDEPCSNQSAGVNVQKLDINGVMNEEENTVKEVKTVEIKSLKYTMIMFVVTLVFVISFFPYLALIVLDEYLKLHDSTGGRLVAYQIGLRSYFLNASVNPIVYGLLNPRFRNFYRVHLSECYQRRNTIPTHSCII